MKSKGVCVAWCGRGLPPRGYHCRRRALTQAKAETEGRGCMGHWARSKFDVVVKNIRHLDGWRRSQGARRQMPLRNHEPPLT